MCIQRSCHRSSSCIVQTPLLPSWSFLDKISSIILITNSIWYTCIRLIKRSQTTELENKFTIQSLIALSGSNSWIDLDWSWMVSKSFSVVVFILPLRLPLQSFIAEKVHSLATDVGGKQRTKSKSLNTFWTPWLANWVWTVGQVKVILLWYLRENKKPCSTLYRLSYKLYYLLHFYEKEA